LLKVQKAVYTASEYNTSHITLYRQSSLDTQLAPVSQTNVCELPNTT